MNAYNQTLRADRRRRMRAFILTALIYSCLFAFFMVQSNGNWKDMLPDAVKDIFGGEEVEIVIEDVDQPSA